VEDEGVAVGREPFAGVVVHRRVGAEEGGRREQQDHGHQEAGEARGGHWHHTRGERRTSCLPARARGALALAWSIRVELSRI